ncbi:MAG: hypothetical protein JKX98_00210, partial [Alcanivoracaceae bacterium]|nr:hypothetical protein [Alcanivoracaceae bacterium]
MCQYYDQNSMRDSANVSNHLIMESMKSAILEIDDCFVLFGGEPLLIPIDHLKHLWVWGLKKYGQNAGQNNVTLSTEQHIDLFKKHQVKVSDSIGDSYAKESIASTINNFALTVLMAG